VQTLGILSNVTAEVGQDAVLRSEGVRVIRTPIPVPNANAHAERVIETIRAECLDWTLIWGGGISTERSGSTRSTTTTGVRIAPSALPRRSQRAESRSRPTQAMSGGGTCSVGSSTSTTAPRRDRIGASDPHGQLPVYVDLPRTNATCCGWYSAGLISGVIVQFAFRWTLDGDPRRDPHHTPTAGKVHLLCLAVTRQLPRPARRAFASVAVAAF
jgi:hypothetical protein